MAVRPFYIESNIEGYENLLKGGPRSKEGTMRTTYYQRNEGKIDTAFTIRSYRDGDVLKTTVFDHEGTAISTYITSY